MKTAGISIFKRTPLLERLGMLLFATSHRVERSTIRFRLFAALPLALVVFASKDRLLYSELAIGAIALVFAANVWLSYANRAGLISPTRSATVISGVASFSL